MPLSGYGVNDEENRVVRVDRSVDEAYVGQQATGEFDPGGVAHRGEHRAAAGGEVGQFVLDDAFDSPPAGGQQARWGFADEDGRHPVAALRVESREPQPTEQRNV